MSTNTFSTVIAVAITGVLLCIIPVMALTARNDDVTRENAQLLVEEYVTEVKNTGVITKSGYEEFSNKLNALGRNVYDIDITVKLLDENQNKKTTQANYVKIGENHYVVIQKTQVDEAIGITGTTNSNKLVLKEGDIVSVEAFNTNSTASQSMKSSFLGFSTKTDSAIRVGSSGMVTVNGK